MQVNVGDTIGQYRLLEQLGRGGMAVVFRAYQPSLDRQVAVKILSVPGPDFTERFRREARAISRLRHPYIVTVFDFGEQEDLVYMVSEYVPGGTLANRMGYALPLDWIGVRLFAMASALDYAHANGVIHRDVKPTNILLTADDMPILSDFGVAKLMTEHQVNLTASGTVVGTPEYMSPEQALGEDVGPPSDVYSLGIVLYEMLAGQPPFHGLSAVAAALAHVSQQPQAPSQRNPALPHTVDQLLATCLAKDPGQRYQRAIDLASDYAAAIGASVVDLSNQAAVTPPAMPRVQAATPLPTPAPRPRPDDQTAVELTQLSPREPRARNRIVSSERAQPRPGRVSRAGLIGALAGLLVAIALVLAVVVALGGPTSEPTQVAATVTVGAGAPGVATITSTTLPVAATAAAAPTATPTTVAPTSTPELRLAPSTPSSLAVRIVEPVNGARMPGSILVRGVQEGPLPPDQHLWLLAGPRQGPENWWVNEPEIEPGANGQWQSRVVLGGESGSFHRIVVGVVGDSGHNAIRRHLAERPGEPFSGSFPPGFRPLADVSVEKVS